MPWSCAKSEEEAQPHAKHLHNNNTNRQKVDNQITSHALEMIETDGELMARKTTVLFHPEWHKGVIGIVASRVMESYYRPTIILTQRDEVIVGSARSVRGFDLYSALKQCNDLLEQFGGHRYAAGLALRPENLEAFVERFEKVVAASIDEALLIPHMKIDTEFQLQEIDHRFHRILAQFGPFGPGNMKPVFLTRKVFDTGYSRRVGDLTHLKLHVKQDGSASFNGIAFRLGEWFDRLSTGKGSNSDKIYFDICYTIEENHWNGTKSLQLNVKDIRLEGAASEEG